MSESRISLCILVNELLRGGAQRIILDLVQNIDTERFEVTVVHVKSYAQFGDAPNLVADIKALGIPVVSLVGGQRTGFKEARALYSFLRSTKPQILHTVLPQASILGRVVGRIAGVPHIVSTQCNLPIAYERFVYWLDRLTLFLASAWIGATESIELAYGGSYARVAPELWRKGRRHFTIVTGVDLPLFDARIAAANREEMRNELGLKSTDVLVLMVARLISWKGHADLISSLKYLPDTVHLGLVGWGPLEGELYEQARSQDCEDRVHFLGARSDVPELLKAADLYAQTHGHAPDGSIWQGPNTSQMEACAAGVPSMSTAVPRIEFLIEDGSTGALAAPDDPRDIARALTTLMEHPDTAQAYAHAARERVEERYTIASMVRSHEILYELIVR